LIGPHSPAKAAGVSRYPRFHSAHHNNKLYSFLKNKIPCFDDVWSLSGGKLCVREIVAVLLITAFPQCKGGGGP
jgi:hypothetical protein